MGLFSRDLDNIRDGFGKAFGAGLAASVFSLCLLTYQNVTAPYAPDSNDLGYYGASASLGYIATAGDNGGYLYTLGPRGRTP